MDEILTVLLICYELNCFVGPVRAYDLEGELVLYSIFAIFFSRDHVNEIDFDYFGLTVHRLLTFIT